MNNQRQAVTNQLRRLFGLVLLPATATLLFATPLPPAAEASKQLCKNYQRQKGLTIQRIDSVRSDIQRAERQKGRAWKRYFQVQEEKERHAQRHLELSAKRDAQISEIITLKRQLRSGKISASQYRRQVRAANGELRRLERKMGSAKRREQRARRAFNRAEERIEMLDKAQEVLRDVVLQRMQKRLARIRTAISRHC